MKKVIFLLLLFIGLAGCGQKGPLYFPDKQAALDHHTLTNKHLTKEMG